MSRELLASQKSNSGIILDPRTKLAVLITIAVFILGGSYEGIMQYYIIVLAAIPLLLLLAAKKWKDSVLYILIFGGSLCLEMFGLSRLTGVLNYIAVAVVGILLRFTPGIVMGYFVVTTTTVSEFVAAMERIHLPKQITIPMSVMFRFFPTVAEEWSAIGDAMRMRGVRFGGGKAGTILEYRMVPMMFCSVMPRSRQRLTAWKEKERALFIPPPSRRICSAHGQARHPFPWQPASAGQASASRAPRHSPD